MKQNILQLYSARLSGFTLILIVLLTTTLFSEHINPLLRFDRNGIYAGEIWRLITGHLVHLSTYHALMNIIGFSLILVIFPKPMMNKSLPITILFMSVAVSFALLIFSTQLNWYLGFSGVIHGLIAFSIVVHLTPKVSIDWLLLVVLIFKVGYEQLPSYDVNYLIDFIHAPVAVDAHLYGTLSGIVWGLIYKSKVASLLQKKT